MQFADHLTEGTEGTADDQAVEHECSQLACGYTPGDHIHAADPQHHPHRPQHQHDHQGYQPGTLCNPLAGNSKRCFDRIGEQFAVVRLVVVGLHGLDLPQRFSHVAAHIGDPVLALPRQAAHTTAEQQDRCQHQRQRYHHDAGELGVGDEQQYHTANDHQRVAQEHRQR
ncbi:hypothetical protein D3C80_1111950 [compost metagenome]